MGGADRRPRLGQAESALRHRAHRPGAVQRQPRRGHSVTTCGDDGGGGGVPLAPRVSRVAAGAGGLRTRHGVHAGLYRRALRRRHPAGLGVRRDRRRRDQPVRRVAAATGEYRRRRPGGGVVRRQAERVDGTYRVVVVARLTVLVVMLLAVAGCATPGWAAPPTFTEGSTAPSMRIGGLDRDYRLYIPAGVESPAPLVVMLHGGFGSAEQAERSYGWRELADRAKFVVAYPDG